MQLVLSCVWLALAICAFNQRYSCTHFRRARQGAPAVAVIVPVRNEGWKSGRPLCSTR